MDSDGPEGKAVRLHLHHRKADYECRFTSELPFPVRHLLEKRTTLLEIQGQGKSWKTTGTSPHGRWPRAGGEGALILHQGQGGDAELPGGEEGPKESPQDQEEGKQSDLSEWNKVTGSGAVQELDLETSR